MSNSLLCEEGIKCVCLFKTVSKNFSYLWVPLTLHLPHWGENLQSDAITSQCELQPQSLQLCDQDNREKLCRRKRKLQTLYKMRFGLVWFFFLSLTITNCPLHVHCVWLVSKYGWHLSHWHLVIEGAQCCTLLVIGDNFHLHRHKNKSCFHFRFRGFWIGWGVTRVVDIF